MSDSTASLARSSAGMAAGTIASRALGVVRAALQALAIGTAAAANGWEVANTLPNIVYLLLAGGVLNAVLVPADHPGRGARRRRSRSTSTAC